MTENRNFKRRVRARAAKTGESYTAALRHMRPQPPDQSPTLRLAVAQVELHEDPRDVDGIRRAGAAMRRLMLEAGAAGARLVHFPEGAIAAPAKRIMSSVGPERIGEADWNRFEWTAYREELDGVAALARELRLWVVFGSVHRLSAPHRPHNSLYVVSDRGRLATRYDERMLSHTKISFMYAPGRMPVTFEVDGVRFGCALGMETHYSEIFAEYERLDVGCVLFSTTGGTAAMAAEAAGHAAGNSFWMGFSVHAAPAGEPAGIAAPDGTWTARAPAGAPSIALADIGLDPQGPARPWRRQARAGIYQPHHVDGDPRSDGRESF